MKAFIFCVCFLGLSFVGMQIFVKMRADEAAARRVAGAKKAARQAEEAAKRAEAEAETAKKAAPQGEEAKRPEAAVETSNSTPPKSSPATPADASAQMPQIVNAARGDEIDTTAPPTVRSFEKRSAPRQMYYTTVDVNKIGVPGRVIIHNTPVGNYTVLLIRSSGTLGMGGKGTARGAGRTYAWEVQANRGSISVSWDGQSVPPGQ